MIFHQKQNTYSISNYSCYRYDNTVWKSHFHRDFEILYVISGTLLCCIGGKTDTLTEGDFAMCLPYEIHSYTPKDKASYVVWGFSENYVRAFALSVKGKTADSFKFRCCSHTKDYVLNMLKQDTRDNTFCVKSCLYGLCAEYLNQVHLSEPDKKSEKALDFIKYIEDNFHRDITLSDAAQHLGYDYHYISRFFKKQFGMNFGDFLSTFRIQKAVSLLEETDKSITSVAFESGFQSLRTFNHCFKKRIGSSPSQYRANIK